MENRGNQEDVPEKTYDGHVKIDIDRYRAREGEKINLKKFPTACDVNVDKESVKMSAFPKALEELNLLQAKLYAQSTYGLVIVLQAMDAAGIQAASAVEDAAGVYREGHVGDGVEQGLHGDV